MTGSLLSLSGILAFAAIPSPITLIISSLVGIIVGWATAWGFNKLKNERVTGDIGMRQLKGSEATVLLKISDNKRGKIRTVLDDQTVDLLAHTLDDGVLERGVRVLIVELKDGTAIVTRMQELIDRSS